MTVEGRTCCCCTSLLILYRYLSPSVSKGTEQQKGTITKSTSHKGTRTTIEVLRQQLCPPAPISLYHNNIYDVPDIFASRQKGPRFLIWDT
jgi:hypothetical protein